MQKIDFCLQSIRMSTKINEMKEVQKSLYIPETEHDECGIGFVANLKGIKSHKVIDDAITMLENMEHRGATGAEPNTGDGAGILMQNPHEFFSVVCKKLGFDLPEFGKYGVGMVSFPSDYTARGKCRAMLATNIKKFGFELLGYRDVPTNNTSLGDTAKQGEPRFEQVFIKTENSTLTDDALERRLFVLRKYSNMNIRKAIKDADKFYINTLSFKTIVYKGQLRASQLRQYFPDLEDPRMDSAIALIHSRFSTNTSPRWKLAQPFRFIAHNGEINTIRGNVNWMKSFETLFRSSLFTKEEIELLLPLLDETQSDSSNLDKIIELLLLGGRPITHVMMMLIPEAWENDSLMDAKRKAFYQFHASLIQPWDGPASICFTDGNVVGACLDRNGLRPSRYCLTDDDMLIMASEAGALPVEQHKVLMKGRLEPGKIFIADLTQGKILNDDDIKEDLCNRKPYGKWLAENNVSVHQLKVPEIPKYTFEPEKVLQHQQIFGFTVEDEKVILAPMFETGKEPIGSMGADTPLAVLSSESQHLSHYFKQLFAQVSNPPMDPIREKLVMSLNTSVGKTLDILDAKPEHCRAIEFDHPVLTNEQIEKVRYVAHPFFKCKTINATFNSDGANGRLEEAIDRMCSEAEDAIRFGCYNVLLISDHEFNEQNAPIPSLLATSAVHQHLLKTGLRARVGLLVEAGDVRETHHFATIIGFGGNAINPYMVFNSIDKIRSSSLINNEITNAEAIQNYMHAINGGLLKIFAKMGISTLRSYHGAQIFEILGLSSKVVDKCFTGSISRIEGLDFDDIAREVLIRHQLAYSPQANVHYTLETGGLYQWKRRGEFHLMNPDSIALLQHAVRTTDYKVFKQFSNLVNEQSEKACTLRSLFDFKERRPILLEEVEPVENILKRFATGAMSFGSISHEAHSTLAIAMNRIGGKSNSGEGGEDPIRFERLPNGDFQRSAIKQVASARFGVTAHYLTNADELQIKIAQGAKPGEGGQLPGHKVDEWIAKVRHSTPGVGLISPPPHHDIYSIEDLAQLIFDLKNANRRAAISVKLVSEAGVGTIASGVAKAKAETILISGGDGGTGASPLSSIRHTGLPWEIGLAEAHQTLVQNNLRSRVTLQTDGQMRTGRDLAIAALLGAEEWGIATGALIAEGCLMMRKCHSNTCPVGIATQDKELRKLFKGKPEHVINYFTFMAEELREIMAQLGFHTVNEMVGQADILKMKDSIDHWKIKKIDLSPILYKQPADKNVGLFKQMKQKYELDNILDLKLIEQAKPALEEKQNVYAEFPILNINRAVGTMLSNEITLKFEEKGLINKTVHFKFIGSAGQSFGAFSVNGVKLELEGEANDYFGKGLSGAELIVYPAKNVKFEPHDNVIVGNVAFYGATSGSAYIRGKAGQRFAVRNSGANIVVEGVGDHGCEYMTGGRVIVLGDTGKNFAAGMSGGIAYVHNASGDFNIKCNMESVEFDVFDKTDTEWLKAELAKHHAYTGSKIAKKIGDNFDAELANFVKVMPTDYKKVLQKQKAEALAASSK